VTKNVQQTAVQPTTTTLSNPQLHTIYILNAKYMCLNICQQYAIIRSKSLPGVGGTGVTGGLIIITDGGAGVATGCAVIGIIIACIIVIIVPSGPITGIASSESPTKTNSPLSPSK
jgi:hypothetical protein